MWAQSRRERAKTCLVGAEPTGVIECPCRNTPHIWRSLQAQPEVCAAFAAELYLELAPRLVGDVAVTSMPNADPVLRWHQVQWQMVMRSGSPFATKLTAPHIHLPARCTFGPLSSVFLSRPMVSPSDFIGKSQVPAHH